MSNENCKFGVRICCTVRLLHVRIEMPLTMGIFDTCASGQEWFKLFRVEAQRQSDGKLEVEFYETMKLPLDDQGRVVNNDHERSKLINIYEFECEGSPVGMGAEIMTLILKRVQAELDKEMRKR